MVRLPSSRSAVLGAYALLFLVILLSSIPATTNAEMNLRVDNDFRGDFDEEMIADMFGPTDLQISPDETLMMVTAKEGFLYIIQDYDTNKPQTTKALQINDMCLESERGLSGCPFHPEFGRDGNRYIYLYYTLWLYTLILDNIYMTGSLTESYKVDLTFVGQWINTVIM